MTTPYKVDMVTESVISHMEARIAALEVERDTLRQQLAASRNAFSRINNIVYAQGIQLGTGDYFEVRKLCCENIEALAAIGEAQPARAEVKPKKVEITASMVKELREKTDAPMMECRDALVYASGDMGEAKEILSVFPYRAPRQQPRQATSEGVKLTIPEARHPSEFDLSGDNDFNRGWNACRESMFAEFPQPASAEVKPIIDPNCTCDEHGACAYCWNGKKNDAAAQTPAQQHRQESEWEGHLIVTKNQQGHIVAVTRQDDDGRVMSVIAESAKRQESEMSTAAEALEEVAEYFEKQHPWMSNVSASRILRSHAAQKREAGK